MKIFVSNLDFSVRNEDLAECFSAYGNVASAIVINDRDTGRSRGFGFVEMENNDEAKAAIDGLEGTSLGSRQLRVAEAQERTERSSNNGYAKNKSYSNNSRW